MLRSASVKRGEPKRPRRLRRDATDAERLFWSHVRDRKVEGAKFRRQWPIGKFVADFCCVEEMLVVEIDGGQHVESKQDDERTKILKGKGYRVIRFWNNEVLENIEGVIETLKAELAADPSP